MDKNKALKVLNLNADVCLEDAKKAYRTLAKRYHPDTAGRNSDVQKDNEARMRKMSDINLAFKSLAPYLKKRKEKSPGDRVTGFNAEAQTDSPPRKNSDRPENRSAGKNINTPWMKTIERWGDFLEKVFFNEKMPGTHAESTRKNRKTGSKNSRSASGKNLKFDEIFRRIHPEADKGIQKRSNKPYTAKSNPYNGYQKFMALKKKVKAMQPNRSNELTIGKIQKISPVKPVQRVK